MSDYERRRTDQYPTIDVDLWLLDGSPALGLFALDLHAGYRTALSGVGLFGLVDISSTGEPHSMGNLIEVDQTYAPGVYRVDLPAHILAAADPDLTVIISGPTIRPRKVTIAITAGVPSGVVLADLRMINGVYINGAGVDGDEFQP